MARCKQVERIYSKSHKRRPIKVVPPRAPENEVLEISSNSSGAEDKEVATVTLQPPVATAAAAPSRGKKKASNKSTSSEPVAAVAVNSAPTSSNATQEPAATTTVEKSGSRKRAQRPATSATTAPPVRPARKARTTSQPTSQEILPPAASLASTLVGGEVSAAAVTPVGEKYERPSWDDYFLEVANAISKRATCARGRSGCVVARDNQLLVSGYVGSIAGFPHCDDVGHLFKTVTHEDGHTSTHCMRTVHAEQNAIAIAARNGVALRGGTLYCRMTPCRNCAMLIINAGIVRVVAERRYHEGAESEHMFLKAGVALEFKHDELQKY